MKIFSSAYSEFKQLMPIAIPAVLSQLAQMAMGVIDTLMAGHYSNEALAAIAIGTSLLHPVLVFFLGLFLAFNPIVAHFKGGNTEEKIASHFRLGIFLAVIFCPIAILILLNAQYILVFLNVNQQVAELATGYLHATVWGMPGLLIFLALRFCNEGLFSTTAIMIATLISIPFNIVFNYWFMYGGTFMGIFHVEEMGAVGVGYATSLVWTMMCIGLWLYTAFTPKYKNLEIFTHKTLPGWHEIKDVLKLGFPMAITLGFEITMFAAVSLMIARYPTEVMGAHQIAVNIASISFMIPLGISQAITARVGYFAGKKDPLKTQLAGFTGIGTSALISGFSATTMVVIPALLVGFYTSDIRVSDIAVSLLFFAAIFQFSDALQVSSAGALRGVKDTKIPMIITAVSYWLVGFPVGYLLAENYQMQASGYWIGLIAGLSTAALLLFRRWMHMSKFLNT
ncbi:MATE family efflux transporter [Aliikangiella sp. G2MR2-5]|uniref:MATE family efflux transporter n=1 Tax=Aliikangiella sp. G2MR2-5 TaxID=2788943 RepID=UPI0018AB1100|nr:MATE family efflux transporter [Aliikangiella sp. G2MR2-5]